ncbi:hypothetical protein [Enterobacter cloacae]|uniref:Uncharacterized protein n=1 Tax=Enterobacter cloacae subsp. cloacae (strain ATCC 13047 / DSM 30054 / NBRC 13535 / NCTC 10005 / WDCM 00083 / NCDC 279-56) TaxID=716541 RepID=A0A0H3CQG9_ENTCC|nr:hypothetical protein [Enterobacter cloacae]ADF63500.1 hypothetical protein ECL_03966 [Enterobacter cloacae subsp. cloacae ATCC 13047]KGB12903.1 hypothetical protein DR74_4627 [Enterobacter cloacae]MBW4206657.1 hypothetical protein [Enterobacter cloacae subsp. cloacae]MBW4231782.1 hypothetical protein [Enterobacter cloacae subsp. cloacae]MCK6883154.1 hypothetical protein [Enterobacter cloacae]
MIDAQQEAKLRSYGFTDKNITALRAVLEDPKRKDRTLHSLLVELKRRFYTTWIIVIGLLFFATYATITNDYDNGWVYFATIIVLSLFILGMAPLSVSCKAVKFLRNED